MAGRSAEEMNVQKSKLISKSVKEVSVICSFINLICFIFRGTRFNNILGSDQKAASQHLPLLAQFLCCQGNEGHGFKRFVMSGVVLDPAKRKYGRQKGFILVKIFLE